MMTMGKGRQPGNEGKKQSDGTSRVRTGDYKSKEKKAGDVRKGSERSGASKSVKKNPYGSKPVGSVRKPVKTAEGTPAGSKPTGSTSISNRAEGKASNPVGRRAVRTTTGYASGSRQAPGKSYSTSPVQSTGISIGARRLALDVLQDVHQNGAYAALALNEHLKKTALNPVDRRLATSIFYGTLENQIRIDYALDRYMERPTQEPVQRDILRLSAYQILFHDRVPDSAAVNEGVNLAKRMGMESSAGFLNAVLRNLSRQKAEIPWPRKEEDLREYLHVMGSMPLWLVDRLIEAYGHQVAENIIMYRENVHPIVVRPNMLRLSDDQFKNLLKKKAWQVRPGLAPHAYLVSGAAEIAMDNDYRDGLFSIQGQSSILAAEAVQAKPGMRILDACAAPGGKSAYLCECMQGTGRVFAWELHEKRAMLLESTKRRLGLENLRISVRDATETRPDMEATLDAVLLDAPCSGLGVLVQKPDLKYRIQEEDIEPIVAQQKKMLEALCKYVKPGGLLVYSTCSILPEENANQVDLFLRNHPEYSLEPLPISFPETLQTQHNSLGLQLLGYRDDVEGFYIARLRKARP